MANSKPRESPSDPLLPPPEHPQPYILLPVYPRRRRNCTSPSTLLLYLLALALTLIAAAVFVLWPSDPSLRVVRLRIDHLHISAKRPVSLDVSLDVKLRIWNPDFFAVDYRSLDVAIGYRGRQLGNVTSDGGRVRARTVSYVDAELRLDGIQVLHDVFYLIEDVLKGSIPFDTVTEIKGVLHFLVFDIPIKAQVHPCCHRAVFATDPCRSTKIGLGSVKSDRASPPQFCKIGAAEKDNWGCGEDQGYKFCCCCLPAAAWEIVVVWCWISPGCTPALWAF